jgi:hypothetical protein
MAFPYYPYQPNYFGNPYQPVQPVPQMQQPQPTQTPQMQQNPVRQSGFVRVRSEEEAFGYPVAPGNSVTFINESAPYCYVKTMGFSQLDRPTFERYRLVKEEPSQNAQNAEKTPDKENTRPEDEYAQKSDVAKLQRDVEALRVAVKTLNEQKPKKRVVVEDEDDE